MTTILKRIVLRYRAPGHLRFQVPRELLAGRRGERLAAAIGEQLGVYRVRIHARQGKVSIRYFDELTGVPAVAAAFAAAAEALGQADDPDDEPGRELEAVKPDTAGGPVGWIGEVMQETKETLHAAGIVMGNVFNPPGTAGGRNTLVSEFLTDILVLYLIKTHWHLIIQHWLKRPWQFRYEWSAAIYMIYLLVRSKKPKP